MTFWGCQLRPGEKYMVKAEDGNVLHLSQACLNKPTEGKNYLQVVDGSNKYAIAVLEKGKSEYASLDLFFRVGQCGFLNKGASEIHLTGYFEPDNMDEDGDDDEEEEEEEG